MSHWMCFLLQRQIHSFHWIYFSECTYFVFPPKSFHAFQSETVEKGMSAGQEWFTWRIDWPAIANMKICRLIGRCVIFFLNGNENEHFNLKLLTNTVSFIFQKNQFGSHHLTFSRTHYHHWNEKTKLWEKSNY